MSYTDTQLTISNELNAPLLLISHAPWTETSWFLFFQTVTLSKPQLSPQDVDHWLTQWSQRTHQPLTRIVNDLPYCMTYRVPEFRQIQDLEIELAIHFYDKLYPLPTEQTLESYRLINQRQHVINQYLAQLLAINAVELTKCDASQPCYLHIVDPQYYNQLLSHYIDTQQDEIDPPMN